MAVFVFYPAWANAALSVFAGHGIDPGSGPYADGQGATWRYGYWLGDMNQQMSASPLTPR